MHELSVCSALILRVEEIARFHNNARVKTIWLDLGPLSGVEPQLLRRAFPLAAAGGIAEDATLSINSCAVRVRCSRCDAETEVRPNRLLCGECGEWRTELLSGDELILRSIELEASVPEQVEDWPPADCARAAAS